MALFSDRIVDDSGYQRPVPGAVVYLTTAMGAPAVTVGANPTTTDQFGAFSFETVADGDYYYDARVGGVTIAKGPVRIGPYPAGPAGPADNTYTSLTALLASDKARKKANLVGDTDVPPAADGPFNVVGGQWVRQRGTGLAVRRPEADAVIRDLESKTREVLSVQDFGIVGDGVTNNDVGLAKLYAAVAARTAAGNTVRIEWPQAGRYVYSVMPNFAIMCLHMHFAGEIWLINVGSGDSLSLDGGTGTGVYGLQITGFPRIYGGTGTRHGVYVRSLYRSTIEVNVRGAGTAYSGFYGEWLVSCDVHFIMNFNEGGLYATPARGMTLTSRGDNPNFQCSYNNLWDCEFSGLPIGVVLDGALGNKFFGGAIQGNTLGLSVTSFGWTNKFFGVDFEVNGEDARDGGRTTQFYGCDFEKGPRFLATARSATLSGGETENIYIDAGAVNTLLTGVIYNRFGAGTVTDAGTRTRSRDMRNYANGTIENVAWARTPVTVGASPFTYTNTTGNDVTAVVYGGVVSSMVLTRFAGMPVPAAGAYLLSPGDSLTATYTGTDKPSIDILTR